MVSQLALLILSSAVACVTGKPHNRTFGKGFARGARNDYVGTLPLSQADRDNAASWKDWTDATSAVKDQGTCGSCWAYSTTEGVETAVYISNGQSGSVPLYSEQQLISCDSEDSGCDGGDPRSALNYLTSVGGIDTESDYPDSSSASGSSGSCSWDGDKVSLNLNWWYAVSPCQGGDCSSQDEEGLAAAVSTYGPMSICLNANWDNHVGWHYDGVYTGLNGQCSSSKDDVDHCVQLVGYDKTSSPPYWKIRNSWGSDWGDNGYIKIPYGSNYCGIANEAYLIQVASGLGKEAPEPIRASTTNMVVV